MTTIRAIETIHVALPNRRSHKFAGQTEEIGGYVITRMQGDDGNVGWGEAPVLKDWSGDFGRYFGETPATTMLMIDRYLAPVVIGLEADNFVELHARMDGMIKGYPYAKAAVELAAYDLAGRSRGVPVYKLLGGKVRDRIPVAHSIGLIPIDEGVEEVRQVIGEGVRTIKLKVGVEPARDVELVRRVREAVGPDIDICADANCGYRSPGEAIQIIREMEKQRLIYIEQPVAGVERIAKVARAVDTPIMADESAWNAHDVLEFIEHRAADIVSIYTTKPGGLYRAMQVAAVAEAAGMPCNVNGSIETGIGNLANVHLAAAAAPVTFDCVVPVSTPAEAQRGQLAGIYYTDDLIEEPFAFADGRIAVPEAPGMGIEVDEEKIERYRIRPRR